MNAHTTESVRRLRQRFTEILGLLAALALTASLFSCSTPKRIEEFLPAADARVFWDRDHSVWVGLQCRIEDRKQGRTGVRIHNGSYLALKITEPPQLFIDGVAQKSDEKVGFKPVEVEHGKDFVFEFATKLPIFDVKASKGNEGSPKMVYAVVGGYRTPTVIVHLAADNLMPFRFANPFE